MGLAREYSDMQLVYKNILIVLLILLFETL